MPRVSRISRRDLARLGAGLGALVLTGSEQAASGDDMVLDNHIMVAAYAVKGDSFVADKPRVWSEKQVGGAANAWRNVDIAPDGKRIVAIMPVETAEGQKAQSHAIFLENFFDELRRRVPTGK